MELITGVNMTQQLEQQKIHEKTVELLYMMDSSDNPLMTAAILVDSLISLIDQTRDEHLLSCVVSYLNEWLVAWAGTRQCPSRSL